MEAYAIAEWNKLRAVAMHKPGLEAIFGLIDPQSFLYERPFSLNKARREHDKLREVLKKEGIGVYRVKKTLKERARVDKKFREKIINKLNVKSEDPDLLVELLLLNPSLKYENRDKGLHLEVTLTDPLSNLYFMRDQQITTSKGMIIGKMATHQREKEIEIVKLFWEALDVKYKEVSNGKLEGGDFFPMKDFILIGIGNRSNIEGARELLSLDSEVGIVHEPMKEFFHLDTYFNVASSNLVIGVEELMKRSKVDIYYDKKLVNTTNLYDYIRRKGFNVINVSLDEARSYVTNFLTIDDGKIISPENSSNKRFKELDVIEVEVSNLTGGAGGIHCMTAVIFRN
ncbi:MAG: arginine deiminase family protein [Saccharolobus sp.]